MTRRLLLLLAVLVAAACPVHAQTVEVAATTLAVGTAPTSPDGTSVRLDNLGTSGGTLVLLTDTDGDVFERILAKGDLPAVVGYTDEAETWSLLQTFTSGLTSNGLLTIGGANDLLLGTGGMRVASGSILLRNVADSATIASFGDSAISLSQPTTFTGVATFGAEGVRSTASPFVIRNSGNSADIASFGDTTVTLAQPFMVNAAATVTGLTTLAKAKTTGLYAVAAPLLFRNAADSATVMSMADTGLDITGTLGISGLTTAAKIRTTGVYGAASPFTVFAADGVTSRLEVADGGPVLLTDTGTDSYLRLAATGASSGKRQWRAGNVTGNYTVSAGNDAADTWTTLAYGTATAGTADGWYWGTGVAAVDPLLSYQTALGNDIYKYLSLSAAELKVGTLVAQDYIATIGGRVMVAPTTTLVEDFLSADTTLVVEHNEMTTGDRVLLEAGGKVEFLSIDSTGAGTGGGDSVTRIGDASAAATSITLPAHTTGDVIIIVALRVGSNTAPTASTGGSTFTNLCNGGGDSTSYRVGYLTAAGSAETSGTWANATHLHAFVFQGVDTVGPSCTVASGTATTTLTYPAMTLADSDGSSYVLRVGLSNQATNDTSVAMSGYTLLENQTGSTRNSSSFLSDTGQTSVTQLDVTLGTSGNTRGLGIELQGTTTPATGPFEYTVTRNLDGTGANDWYAGDAVLNTGTTGDGFWDIYSIQSVNGGTEAGPTMCANERTSSTYNAWAARFCAGNLNGLYGNSATDLYGVAFGNYSDVWGQMDSTNGLRFFEGGSNQKLRIDPTGYVLLGTSGSGQANTYIDNTNLKLRRGTVDYVDLSSAGLVMGDGTNTRVTLDATTGLLLGRTTAGHGNTLIDTSGNLYLRSGTVNRIALAASNGNVDWLDDDGSTVRARIGSTVAYFGGTTGARFQFTYGGAFEGYDSAGTRRIYWDNTFGIVVGEPTGPYLSLTDTTLTFCANSGTACTLSFNGTSGDITSTGSILLSTGGGIASTGNFELSAANGLYLQQHSAYDTDPGTKGIKWSSGPSLYTWSNNLIANAGTTNWTSGNNAIRMVLYPAENVIYDNPAMRVNVLLESGSVVTPLGVDGAVARTATVYPFADNTSTIGDSSLRYVNINLNLPSNSSPTYVVVNKGGGGGDASSALGYIDAFDGTKVAGSCTFTIVAGLVTNVTGC